MDFSTMSLKIEEGRYENLSSFRRDFELICNNCMLYNGPDTIYYKAGSHTNGQPIRFAVEQTIM